jgi:hypothetical protein
VPFTSVARLSATAIGFGPSVALASSRLAPPVSTRTESSRAFSAAAMSASRRSPITSVRPSPSRSSAVKKSCGSGLPMIAASRPEPTSTAARIAPVPGHRPSGIG